MHLIACGCCLQNYMLCLLLLLLICRLSSVAYAAIACFALEYLGLFLGVSIFMRGHSCLYIILHFVGAILTGLLYTNVSTAHTQSSSGGRSSSSSLTIVDSHLSAAPCRVLGLPEQWTALTSDVKKQQLLSMFSNSQ
jgi:hypothetical protein